VQHGLKFQPSALVYFYGTPVGFRGNVLDLYLNGRS
jgi:hypothetical protein